MPEEKVPEVKRESESTPVSPESVPAPEIGEPSPEADSEKGGERLEGKYLEILQKTAPAANPTVVKDDEVVSTAKSIGALTDEEAKVTRLLEVAEQKGVTQAVKIAYALKDYYVLDRMHDELADKFYEALKEKGLTKE